MDSVFENMIAMHPITIYVKLIDEPVPMWRPVKAELIGGNIYQIVPQPYDREIEQWEFQPGDRVVCESIALSEGATLAAVRLAE